MSPYDEFDRLMSALEDWYADSTRAQAYDGPGHGSSDPGHRILHVNRYPGPPWRRLWAETNELGRAAILRSLDDELFGLSHGPSRAGPASGLVRGTQEFDRTVARASGSLRAVARRFGVSHTEVRRLRMEHSA